MKYLPILPLILFSSLYLITDVILAQPSGSENEWTEIIVESILGETAKTQAVLYDGTRPDILTLTKAIEVDWCHKWAEGIGQSLYYGKVTDRKPVVILLTRPGELPKDDRRYIARAIAAMPSEGAVWWYDCNTRKFLNEMEPAEMLWEPEVRIEMPRLED